MSRNHPYLNKPPTTFTTDVAAMRETPLFLVSRPGPTVFFIKTSDTSLKPFKVYIGFNQRCSCGGGEARSRLCMHLLFVMIKVLRVKESEPLSWQLSLVEEEVTRVLDGRGGDSDNERTNGRRNNNFLRRGHGSSSANSNNRPSSEQSQSTNTAISRQDLTEDEICPICQDYMTQSEFDSGVLCFCEMQCGSNIHSKCLLMYATHLKSEKKPILCPMCRTTWGPLPTPPPSKPPQSAHLHTMPSIKCKACKKKCHSTFLRCITCVPTFDFCKQCFEASSNRNHHDMSHPFVSANATSNPSIWTASVPPTDRSSTLSILQNRELSDSDYYLLLSLDGENVPPLHRHLVQGLRKVKPNQMASIRNGSDECIVCNENLSIDKNLRILPCAQNHVAHESCVLNYLIEAQSFDAVCGAVSVTCPGCNDGVLMFPSLKRCPRRKKADIDAGGSGGFVPSRGLIGNGVAFGSGTSSASSSAPASASASPPSAADDFGGLMLTGSVIFGGGAASSSISSVAGSLATGRVERRIASVDNDGSSASNLSLSVGAGSSNNARPPPIPSSSHRRQQLRHSIRTSRGPASTATEIKDMSGFVISAQQININTAAESDNQINRNEASIVPLSRASLMRSGSALTSLSEMRDSINTMEVSSSRIASTSTRRQKTTTPRSIRHSSPITLTQSSQEPRASATNRAVDGTLISGIDEIGLSTSSYSSSVRRSRSKENNGSLVRESKAKARFGSFEGGTSSFRGRGSSNNSANNINSVNKSENNGLELSGFLTSSRIRNESSANNGNRNSNRHSEGFEQMERMRNLTTTDNRE